MMMTSGLVIVGSANVAAEQDGDFTYTVSGSPAVATITGYTGHDSQIDIPATLGGYVVAAIGDEAFIYYHPLKVLNISSTVTSIGYRFVYDCYYLESILVDKNNPNYTSVDGVLYNKKCYNAYPMPSSKDRRISNAE